MLLIFKQGCPLIVNADYHGNTTGMRKGHGYAARLNYELPNGVFYAPFVIGSMN